MNTFVKALKFLIIAAILGGLTWLVVDHNTTRIKVLVVHSYSTDLAWVNDVNEGIRRGLGNGRTNAGRISLRTHYMNLRNHPDCNFYQNAASDVAFTIEDWSPDVVILVDDLAQGLVGFNQLALRPDADRTALARRINAWLAGDLCETPDLAYFGLDQPAPPPNPEIIFAGVNGGVTLYGYDAAGNVSGIFERKNFDALIETLEVLADSYGGPVAGVKMLNDASATGRTESANFLTRDWAPFARFDPVNAATFEDWKAAVARANAQDVMLLIANYQNVVDGEGRLVPAKQLIRWTEANAKLPMLGANTRFVADGGMMTLAISGIEQGEVAMSLAKAVLNGDQTRPRREAKQFLIGMNQALVRKRSLELPAIYEAFSREIAEFVDVLEELYIESTEAEQ